MMNEEPKLLVLCLVSEGRGTGRDLLWTSEKEIEGCSCKIIFKVKVEIKENDIKHVIKNLIHHVIRSNDCSIKNDRDTGDSPPCGAVGLRWPDSGNP